MRHPRWFLLFLALAVVTACAGSAAPAGAAVPTPGGEFFWQNPQPQGNPIYDLELDGMSGFALCAFDQVLWTTDGGISWVEGASPGNGIEDIGIADSGAGWAVGGGGGIYRTVNGGATWTPQISGVTDTLYRVLPLSGSEAWVVGDSGAILHTSDGGANWAASLTPSTATLMDITWSGRNNGWAVGGGDTILRTTNGGLTWFHEDPGVGEDYSTVVSNGLSDLWVSGTGGAVLQSFDGGMTWRQDDTGTGNDLFTLVVLGDGTAVAAGQGGSIVYSTDGGGTWKAGDVPTGAGVNGLMLGGADLWAGCSNGAVLWSNDKGVTWQRIGRTLGAPNLRSVCWAADGAAWAAGVGGSIWGTKDGGATWVEQQSGSAVQLNDVAAGDVDHAWSVGNGGTLVATTNAGLGWFDQDPGVASNLNSVDATDTLNAWTVGAAGVIRHTADGGSTAWTGQTSNTGQALRGVDFNDSTHGIAVGNAGVVRYTTNGATWQTGASNTGSDLYGVAMVDNLTAYAVGLGGTIIKTADGGATWAPQVSPVTNDFYCVACADATHVLVVGAGPGVVASSDGSTFVEQSQPTVVNLRSAATRGTSTLVVGDQGTVLANHAAAAPQVTAVITTSGNGSVVLTWTNPPLTGGAMAYVSAQRYAFSPLDTVSQRAVYEGAGHTVTATGLTNGRLYYFSIFARTAAGTWSPPVSVFGVPAAPFKVTIKTSATTVKVNTKVKFSGKVTPVAPNQPFELQKKSGSTWKKVIGGRITQSGSYSISKALPKGKSTLRVWVPTMDMVASAGVSASKTVTWK